MFILLLFIKIISLLLPILLTIAYLTLVERKVMAAIQRRIGPNFIGFLGLLQPIADAFKLLLKETLIPTQANSIIFIFSPIITFILSLTSWSIIPTSPSNVIADIELGIILSSALSSLSVYGIIMAGWASNSHYAFLGALRSPAQMISYEISLGIILSNIVICVGSLNSLHIAEFQEHIWLIFPLFPLFLLFIITALAETNRSPFDLPEAEGEIVAGHNVEYGSITSTLSYISEYGNIVSLSTLTSILFLGAWHFPIISYFIPFEYSPYILAIKVLFILFLFIWTRASLPRFRYDVLMRLGWKVFLPLSFGLLSFNTLLLFGLDIVPNNLIA